MINFFRNIRQKLISEGKLTNYMKYAIGEIVLVMVGILLALQVNNWNENRKEKINEKRMIASFRNELGNNINQLDKFIKFSQTNLDTVNLWLKGELQEIPDQRKARLIPLFTAYRISNISYPVMNEILIKNTEQISDKELLDKVRQLQSSYTWMESDEKYLTEFWNTTINDFLSRGGYMTSFVRLVDNRYIDDPTFIALFEDKIFKSIISSKKLLHQDALHSVKISFDLSKEILAFTDKKTNGSISTNQ